MLDSAFFRVAQSAFNPYTPAAGTEHVALLLYALVRATRPRTVVEFGSGYTTLFLLRALADNAADLSAERHLLRAREDMNAGFLDAARDPAEGEAALQRWVATGGAGWGLDPAFYLGHRNDGRLYSFEERPEDDSYVCAMKRAVATLGHGEFMEHVTSSSFDVDAIPDDRFPIDLAWNDHHSYRRFCEVFWDRLNPAGGLLVLHNVTGHRELWDDLVWMRGQHTAADLEVLVIAEPHKLHQNGCAVLRRVTDYHPAFRLEQPAAVARDLSNLVDQGTAGEL